MTNPQGYLSATFNKFNTSNVLKRLINGRYLCVAAVLVHCSLQAQTLQNDSDGDGLSDVYELKIGSEPYLSDTDGDTVKDAEEVGENQSKPYDSDNDGIIDVLDYDDDNDGLPSYLESKKDSDNDGLLDYLDSDSDSDGIADGVEAGRLNQDKNLDGIDDAFDASREGAVDNNGDGIDDGIKLPDYNSDGRPDYLDAKYQYFKQILVKKPTPKEKRAASIKKTPKNKRIENKKVVVEATQAPVVKSKQQANKLFKPDDIIINRHTDSDNDGLSNSLEKMLGTNHLSRDSDADKVSDAIEIGLDIYSPQDSDGDGIIDALDNDDDNDGVLTKLEDVNKDSTAINDDTDADGIPNYLDINDDGDNLLTKVEGFILDSDGDGILDYLDKSDSVKSQSSSLNSVKLTQSDNATTAPEIVVLLDDRVTTLVTEEVERRGSSLGSPEGALQYTQLNGKRDTSSVAIGNDKEPVERQTARSSKKPTNHWDLF